MHSSYREISNCMLACLLMYFEDTEIIYHLLDSKTFGLLHHGYSSNILAIIHIRAHSCKHARPYLYYCRKCSHNYLRGDGEIRTHDPLLARQVLSQLSYTPINVGSHLLSHIVSNAVPSAALVLTIVFGMGTGVSPKRIATRISWVT